MKKYKVAIKPTAEDDLERRYLQIAEDSPQSAINWYLDFIETIEKLDTLAERCPLAPEDLDIQRGVCCESLISIKNHTPIAKSI